MSEPAKQSVDPPRTDASAAVDDDLHRWFSSLGHGLGMLTRSVVNGLDQLLSAIDKGGRVRQPQPAAQPHQSLPELLQQLGQLMAAHAEQGYATLAESLELQRLVAQVSAAFRQARLQQRASELQAQRAERKARMRRNISRRRAAQTPDSAVEPEGAAPAEETPAPTEAEEAPVPEEAAAPPAEPEPEQPASEEISEQAAEPEAAEPEEAPPEESDKGKKKKK